MQSLLKIVFWIVAWTGSQVFAGGYAVCRDTSTGQELIECDTTSCPIGTTLISWSPHDHPSCDGGGGGGSQDKSPAGFRCVAEKKIKDLGYQRGHKTRYCKTRGFDGYNSRSGECVADCSKACVKVFIKRLGWTDGHKTRFCKRYGWDGVHNPRGNDYKHGGYCFKGTKEQCGIR
jgi:hypothetical protein